MCMRLRLYVSSVLFSVYYYSTVENNSLLNYLTFFLHFCKIGRGNLCSVFIIAQFKLFGKHYVG